MQRPNEGRKSGVPYSTITYLGDDGTPDAIDRQLEEELSRIVHDSPFDYKSAGEVRKYGVDNPVRAGFPRHEW